MKLRKIVVSAMLSMLNSRWLNATPCSFAFVGNVDNFSREDIEGTLENEPEITLREYLTRADRFKVCPASRIGVTVIEPDGSYTKNIEWR